MCLTIPKKVISIENGSVIVEDFQGHRQEMKTIVELETGDFCVSQQNVVVQKLNKDQAQEIFNILDYKEERI